MPKDHDYNTGDQFYYHVWRKLKVGDIITIAIGKKKLLVRAKVIEHEGTDKYKLESLECEPRK